MRALETLAGRTGRSVSDVALDYLPKDEPRALEGGRAEGKAGPGPVPLTLPDSTVLVRRDRDEVSENRLTGIEAVRLCREIRAMALKPLLPDSTPSIRADRDAA